MPLLRERLEQPNKQPNSFPASTGQDSCRRAVRIVDIDHTAADLMFEQDFADHCLAFDAVAARNYALIVSERTRHGHPITTEDAQIAATAMTNELIVATRNTADFKNIQGLEIVNPWEAVV